VSHPGSDRDQPPRRRILGRCEGSPRAGLRSGVPSGRFGSSDKVPRSLLPPVGLAAGRRGTPVSFDRVCANRPACDERYGPDGSPAGPKPRLGRCRWPGPAPAGPSRMLWHLSARPCRPQNRAGLPQHPCQAACWDVPGAGAGDWNERSACTRPARAGETRCVSCSRPNRRRDPHRLNGRGHRPCHSAAPGSRPAGGQKPPASARPALSGRFSPAGSGAGLCVSRTCRSTGDRPTGAGETRCVSCSRPN